MKNNYFTYILGLMFTVAIVTTDVNAQQLDVSQDQLSQIQNRVDSMSISEMKDRREALLLEKASLEDEQETSQSPAVLKEGRARLDLVRAELWVLVGALLAVNGLDGESDYVEAPDTTPPVITINGDNPATVELGGTYTDAGAYADDGSVVTSSGTVDTNTVGSYTITYSATDFFGNTGTATRTVNVVDTTAPVFTSSASFSADENQTAIGTVTATDLQTVTFSVSGSELAITSGGVLTFITAPDYETKSSYTATVTATDASSNATTQDITVTVNDVGGIDDDPGTGTGTGTGTSTTGSGTGTSTS